MTEPREYRAILNLQAALRAISVAGGYFHDVQDVAVKLDPNHTVEDIVAGKDGLPPLRPFVLIEVKPAERWVYETAMRLDLTVPLSVHFVNDIDVTVDESQLQTFFRACADVEQAVGVDIQRGGLVASSRITGRRLAKPDDAELQAWAIVDLELHLFRSYGQPNG